MKKSGSAFLDFFSGSRKVVDQKKNPSLQNHFSRTTFLEKWLQIKWLSEMFGQQSTYQKEILYFVNTLDSGIDLGQGKFDKKINIT